MEHLLLSVGEMYPVKGDCVVPAGEGSLCLGEGQGAHELLQGMDLVAHLGHGGQEGEGPEKRGACAEGHAEHQGQVRQGGVVFQDKEGTHRKGEEGHAGKDAVVQRHPGPAHLVPGQGEIPVAPDILLKAPVGVPVPVEDLYHLHAVDVLHNGVVHLPG